MTSMRKRYLATVKQVYDSVAGILRDLNVTITKAVDNGRKFILEASTRTSLRSWGERIRITITRVTEEVEVEIESLPLAQVFDWGKSMENVQVILTRLDSILPQR